MADPIRFYFDFASPYAYFAFEQVGVIANQTGREVSYCPILMWAVLKAHGIAPPMDAPVKRDYFLRDMKRSAAFYGLAYNEPVKLPMSSHLAARLYHVVDAQNARQAVVLARTLFHAFFVDQQDISQEDVLLRLSLKAGLDEATARDALSAPLGRTLLEKAVTRATADQVVGSPFFLVDGVGFFGADRLPQLRWFLAGHQRADLF